MLRSALIYMAIGTMVSLATLALAWWMGETGFIARWRWQVVALVMLGFELIFLLFISGNKGGQQFGPQSSFPMAGPPVSSGADFYDAHPVRRLGDLRWLLVGGPILLAAIAIIVSLAAG